MFIFLLKIFLLILFFIPFIIGADNCLYKCRDGKENLVDGRSDFKGGE